MLVYSTVYMCVSLHRAVKGSLIALQLADGCHCCTWLPPIYSWQCYCCRPCITTVQSPLATEWKSRCVKPFITSSCRPGGPTRARLCCVCCTVLSTRDPTGSSMSWGSFSMPRENSVPTRYLLTAINIYHSIHLSITPSGLRGCKNRPAPFPGRMLYKATN